MTAPSHRRHRAFLLVLGVLAAVAAVVGLAVGGPGSPGVPEPPPAATSPPRASGGPDPVAAHLAPATVDVLGFPFALVRAVDLPRSRTTKLLGSPDDRAVVLVADDLGSGTATLLMNGAPVARVLGTDPVSLPVPVELWGGVLEVRVEGAPEARTGLAYYRATEALGPGVHDPARTLVYRRSVADRALVATVFSEPGASEIRLRAPGPDARLQYAPTCVSDDPDLVVDVAVDGRPVVSVGCGSNPRRDAGLGAIGLDEDEWSGVRRHDVRVFLTRGSNGGAPGPVGAVRFGVGVYRAQARVRVPTAHERHAVARTVEHLGRRWRFVGVRRSPSTIDTADGDVLVGFAAEGYNVGLTWTGQRSGEGHGAVKLRPGGATSVAGMLLAGDRYRVQVDGTAVGDAVLLVYRPE